MTTISQQQALSRWETLPRNIREAMTSESNADFLWKTCEAEHLPKEKIKDVARIAGYVLLGFVHPGDMAQELQDSISLNPQTANSLANAVNERIFSQLKADLDKIYEPPSALAPKSVVEIKPFDSAQGKPPVVSRIEPFEIKITEAPSPSKAPTSSMPATLPPFKIDLPWAPSLSKPEMKGAEPPPTMLHEEPLLPSSKFTQGFRIEVSRPKFSEVKVNEAPARPAVLEFGQAQTPKPPATSGMGPNEKMRVVHYTDFKTPLGSAPASAEREIKEITSELPKPPASNIPKPLASTPPIPIVNPSAMLEAKHIDRPTPPPVPPRTRPPLPPKPFMPPVVEIKPPAIPKPPIPPTPPKA